MIARRLVKHVRDLAALTGESISEAVRTAMVAILAGEPDVAHYAQLIEGVDFAWADIQPAGTRP